MRKRIYFILFYFLALILSVYGKANNVIRAADSGNYTCAFIKIANQNAPEKTAGMVKGCDKHFRHIIRSKALDDTHTIDLVANYTLPCCNYYYTEQVYYCYKESAYNEHILEYNLRGPPSFRCVS